MSWIKQYKKTIGSNRFRLKDKSHLVGSPFGTIEYSITGDEGPVVLISHGGAGGFDQGEITAEVHLNGPYRILCPSRFGHLRSEIKDDSGAEKQAEAYAWLLDFLNIRETVVLGTSGGGPSSILFAQKYHEKCIGLILSCAVSHFLPARPAGIYKSDFIYWLVTTKLKSLALQKIGVTKKLEKQLTGPERDLLMNLFESSHPISNRREGLFRDIEEWADHQKWRDLYHLDRITTPTLVIHATDDTVIPYEHGKYSSESIRNAELLTLKRGGHLKLGHRKEIQIKIESFIKRCINEKRIAR